MSKRQIAVSNTQKVEICMGADVAHEFFSRVGAKLLEPAGEPTAADIAVTIYIKTYTTPDEEVSGGIEITIDHGGLDIGKGEVQLDRLDF